MVFYIHIVSLSFNLDPKTNKQSKNRIDDPAYMIKLKEFKDIVDIDQQNKSARVLCLYAQFH